MASETESFATSPAGSDIVSLHSEDALFKLPEHDENVIHHRGKTYQRGKARPAKQKDKSFSAWYWEHGEEITEGGKTRWKCEQCWEDKKFAYYGANSNKAIVNHLQENHGTSKKGATSISIPQIQL